MASQRTCQRHGFVHADDANDGYQMWLRLVTTTAPQPGDAASRLSVGSQRDRMTMTSTTVADRGSQSRRGSARVSTGDEMRPDCRTPTPETSKLRVATRTLRLHLDTLPIDYDLRVSGDRFLAGLAFVFARQRYDCADSMIGAGFGGTVLGSMARSLFVDGLRWLWIGRQPARRRCLLGDLLEERNGICVLLEESDATCPILPRWLMPLPDVTDLTGESLTWLDAPSMPGEEQLLQDFLTGSQVGMQDPTGHEEHALLVRRARTLTDMAGLRGAVMVLAHAGHGNYLGLQSSLTDDGAVGHDLRADHEALFMQVAAAGVTATLLGTAAAVPELWPADVGKAPFLEQAVDLAADVTSAAVAIHRLGSSRRPPAQVARPSGPRCEGVLLRPRAVLATDDLLPDVNSADAVIAAAERYYKLGRRASGSMPGTTGSPHCTPCWPTVGVTPTCRR